MTKKNKIVVGDSSVNSCTIGEDFPLAFIGGPCAIESLDHAMDMAGRISEICNTLSISWIYKSCYDKDCRSSANSFHGVGLDQGMKILDSVRKEYKVPVVSDFSVPSDAEKISYVCDLIQIPAYLCRQTSILRAAAETKKPILLKKGQFMSPWNMKNSAKKIEKFGGSEILLTERGSFYGYNMLVNDMRSFNIMSSTGYPVCYDATHSIQMPTSMGNISGGQREFIPSLVRAACAAGINALFMEVHDNPDKALSDANTVLNIKYLKNILIMANSIHDHSKKLIKEYDREKVD